MRVLLLQLDGKLPNIALMRLSAHHRERGDDVELRKVGNATHVQPELYDRHDKVYASLIFERSRPVAEALLATRPDAIVGGTGWSVGSALEEHGITTLRQDYSIYPTFMQSIGFTQRGCRLRCSFCVVPKKEGSMRAEQDVHEIWRGDPYPRELLLLDNDFFGQPRWRDRVDELRAVLHAGVAADDLVLERELEVGDFAFPHEEGVALGGRCGFVAAGAAGVATDIHHRAGRCAVWAALCSGGIKKEAQWASFFGVCQ